MATRIELLQASCSKLAKAASDSAGFVPMHVLATICGIRIEARPLLVEATLASVTGPAANSLSLVVLVDSERFDVTTDGIQQESRSRPLPTRLRTTIAHELLHSLTFREGENGYELDIPAKRGEAKLDYIRRVEKETEKFTPLLLVPDSEVTALAAKKHAMLHDFLELRNRCGVSREILINRFALLKRDNPLLHRTGLENIAIGILKRMDVQRFQLEPWPIFANFENNRLPWFIRSLSTGRTVDWSSVDQNPPFILNGGTELEIELNGHHERETLDYMRMKVHFFVEPINPFNHISSLFFVQKTS